MAVLVRNVSKCQSVCGTRLLACGHEFAVADQAILFEGGNPRSVDPLNAIRAFLHDAAAAYGDIRVVQEFQRGSIPFRILKEIEVPDFARDLRSKRRCASNASPGSGPLRPFRRREYCFPPDKR